MISTEFVDGWHVTLNPKPIPDRRHDWDFWHNDYDGENKLCGTAESVGHALTQIEEIEESLPP